MLMSLYFPVTCNPSRAVTLQNIGVLQYIRVPHRVTFPYVRGRKHNPAKIAEAPYVTNVHWTNQALLNQKLREAYGATLPAAS